MKRQMLIAAALLGSIAWAQSPEELFQSAQKLEQNKDYDQALDRYKALWGSHPSKSGEALFRIGWIYNEQHKYDSAVRWLKKAIEQSPNDASYHSELGYAYFKLGNPEGALQCYGKSSQLKPDNPNTWAELGDVHYELKKDFKAASNAYLKAIELGHKSASAYYRLGWCYNDQNLFAQALPQLKLAAELDPQTSAIWLEWGYSLLRTQKGEEAVQSLTKALVLDPQSRLGHLYLGRAYLMMGQREKAKKEVDALLNIDPETSRLLEREMLP